MTRGLTALVLVCAALFGSKPGVSFAQTAEQLSGDARRQSEQVNQETDMPHHQMNESMKRTQVEMEHLRRGIGSVTRNLRASKSGLAHTDLVHAGAALMRGVVLLQPLPATAEPQLMHLRLANSVYVDPKGFFTIRPPEGWTMNEYRSDPRGKVDFNRRAGPKQVQLKVIGAANPFTDFDALLQDCRNAVERLRTRYGGTYRIEKTNCAGTNAVLLLTSLPNGFKQYQVQLLAADNYYTLAYGTDKHLYDNYLPLAMAAMNTLEALPKGIKSDEARAHIVASKIRLARLFQGVGKNKWALTAVNEGLGVEASNAELRQLKQELEER